MKNKRNYVVQPYHEQSMLAFIKLFERMNPQRYFFYMKLTPFSDIFDLQLPP